jgi:hypothetical protein
VIKQKELKLLNKINMEEWQKFVPKDKWDEFRATFVSLLPIDTLLNDAAFYEHRHIYHECPKEGEGCDDCYGDSTDRDLRDDNEAFYSKLWQNVFETMKIQEVSHNDDGEEEEEEEEEETKRQKTE